MAKRRLEYSVEGGVPPERVINALTDMSANRLKYWPAQTANQFRVIERGARSAVVREGSINFWEQARYDWSKPGIVVATVEDSNFLNPGTTWEFRVRKRTGGGCHVDVAVERDFKGWRGLIVEAGYRMPGAATALAFALKRTMAILENEESNHRTGKG
jgi:hypothetical protein